MGAAAATLLLSLSPAGCSAPQSEQPAALAATDAARTRVHRQIDRADSEQRSTPELTTLIRWNPADCECPPWEARVFGRWERLTLLPSRDAGNAVNELLGRADWSAPPLLSARLRPESEVTRDQWGWGYAAASVVELVDISDEDTTP